MVFDYSDPGLRRIPCYTLLHPTEVLSECCKISASVICSVKYKHLYRPIKSLIDQALPKIQSKLVSSLAQLTILCRLDSGIDLMVETLERFQIIIASGHSSFIASQSMFVPTNLVLKRYLT